MSPSEVRRRRKLKRGIGKPPMTRQRTISLMPMFQPPISKGLRLKPEYVYKPPSFGGGEMHHLADIDVSLSYPTLPKVSPEATKKLQEQIVGLCKLPAVTVEEVNKVAERLSSTDAVRF